MYKKVTVLAVLIAAVLLIGCTLESGDQSIPSSKTGEVVEASANIQVDPNTGLTVEQENVKRRLEQDNQPGSIKHLYVFSAYTGDLFLYSTVKGKVTSSGKRLTPYQVACMDGRFANLPHYGMEVEIGDERKYTPEVLQDDGTYGHSIPYLYWWDAQDRYHQHYVAGGQVIHISDQPIRVKKAELAVNLSE